MIDSSNVFAAWYSKISKRPVELWPRVDGHYRGATKFTSSTGQEVLRSLFWRSARYWYSLRPARDVFFRSKYANAVLKQRLRPRMCMVRLLSNSGSVGSKVLVCRWNFHPWDWSWARDNWCALHSNSIQSKLFVASFTEAAKLGWTILCNAWRMGRGYAECSTGLERPYDTSQRTVFFDDAIGAIARHDTFVWSWWISDSFTQVRTCVLKLMSSVGATLSCCVLGCTSATKLPATEICRISVV